MAELTLEQRRALALARARRRKAEATGNPPPEGMTATQATERDLMASQAGARMDQARETPGIVRAATSVAQGVPFVGEYVDEAVGAVAGPQAMDRMRAVQEANAADAPVMNTVGQLAGGVLGGIPMAMAAGPAMLARAPASLAGKVVAGGVAGAVAGGTEGAISGYGAGNDGDRVDSATMRGGIGAGLGGVVGAAAPAVASGVANVVRSIRGRPDAAAARAMGGSPEGVSVVGQMLRNDGADAGRNIAASGPGGMVADAGASSRGLLDYSIQRAGSGGTVAREAIETRAADATADMRTALDDFLGAPQGVRSAGREISQRTAPARQAAYDAAYARPVNYAAPAGRKVEDVLNRIPPRTLNAAVQDANEEMLSRGLRNEQIMARIGDDGTVTFTNPPNVRQLDAIKQALDKAGSETDIFGRPTADALRPRRLARELRQALGDAVPEYNRAVSLGGQKIAEDNALHIGRRVLSSNTTVEDVADAMEGATQAQIAAAKRGLRSQIDNAMGNVRRAVTDSNMDAREGLQVLRDLSSRNVREKVSAIMGPDAAPLLQRVDQATKAFELRAATAQNSKTFARQSMDDAVSRITDPGFIGELLQGSPVASARKLVQSMTNMSPAAREQAMEKIAGEIASILTTARGPAAVQRATDIARLLERQPVTEALAKRIGTAVSATAAGAGYHTGSRALSTPR